MAEHFITGITKEGSVILISLNDRPNPIKYNCNTGELTSFTGRVIKHFPHSCSIGNVNEGQRWAINVTIERIETGSTHEFELMEKYIAALDLINNPWRVPNECPQGYIKWVRDNDSEISIDTLAEFQNIQKINKLTKEDKDVYEKLHTAFSNSDRIIVWWLNEENVALRQKFRQIFKATIKSFTWNMYNDLCDWQRFFIVGKNGLCVWGDNWIEYLDGNRDFRYNLKTCEEQKNKARNEKILANEEKIRSITEIQHDNFIIVVPSTMDDFTKEGQMQNNCVGSYYHDSIARGDNLIYFIRRKETPNRSYITNRFSVCCQKTVETRKINNRDNDDKEALILIEEIDKKIKELLASKE